MITPSHSHPIRIALTGAGGGFGRTLLAQLRYVPAQEPAVLIDPDLEATAALLADLGYPAERVVRAGDDAAENSRAIGEGRILLAADAAAFDLSSLDVLVEATGVVPVGVAYARAAIAAGAHVVMVSKEVETVAGVDLARRAEAAGVSYLPGDGDQPANLLRLLDWVEYVGLEVVACGKSGEYDLVFDPEAGTVRQLDAEVPAPGLAGLLSLGEDARATLAARAEAVRDLKRAAAADSCEMTVVSQYSGYTADVESLHYPVVRPDELADVYAEEADGGLVRTPGAVDVFSMLRLPEEASFAGGVFAVVRTHDAPTWELLRQKGHVVSRDGRYACLYWPYHAMGVETPLTIAAAVEGRPGRRARAATLLGARATRDLAAGTALTVAGHHHEIDGLDTAMLPGTEAQLGVAAFYTLGGTVLNRGVAAGELIRAADVDGLDAGVQEAFASGFGLDDAGDRRPADLAAEARGSAR